jgi:hypothetical protein
MLARLTLCASALLLFSCDDRLESRPQNGHSAAAALRMPVPRAAHGAVTLADGRVLLIGGCVAQSCEAGTDSATVDAFDPRTGRFARAGTLVGRRLSAATLLLPSGEVLIAGGWSGPAVTRLVELFDPRTGRSRRIGDLSVARSDIAAALLSDGRVILAGGYDGSAAVPIVEIFNPATSTLAKAGELAVARAGAGGIVLSDGRLLVAGGAAEGMRPTAAAELFDPSTGRSAAVRPLGEARYKHALVALKDGGALAIGGSDHRDSRGKLGSIELFDPAVRAFRPAGRLLEPRYKIGASVLVLPDNRLLVAGGGARAEIYDPASGQSRYVGPDFGKRLNFATASLLPDGSVLVAGGYDEAGIRMSSDAWIVRTR